MMRREEERGFVGNRNLPPSSISWFRNWLMGSVQFMKIHQALYLQYVQFSFMLGAIVLNWNSVSVFYACCNKLPQI